MIIVYLVLTLLINISILIILISDKRKKLNVRIIDMYQDNQKSVQDLEGQLYQLKDCKIKDIKFVKAGSHEDNYQKVYIFYYE